MSHAAHDRNLLFGILAFQMSFVDRDQLIDAMHAWVLEKARSLGEIMVEKGFLAHERSQLLSQLVQEHIKQYDNDARKSLAALNPDKTLSRDLGEINDDQLQHTLSVVSDHHGSADANATQTFSVADACPTHQRFQVLRHHAEGGLGTISLALDEELHREVALKELKSCHADNIRRRLRFLLEAEINGKLEHPGIVPVYGCGQYADGRPFYAMRFIRGITLDNAINRFHQSGSERQDSGERSLEFRQLLENFVDVCQAIHYAHCRGVLHRDLKPENIMLGKHGETLVVDWGLAKFADRDLYFAGVEESQLIPSSGSDSAPTEMGRAMGTPAFMSPEQAAGEWDKIGPTTDVYSLGATLYKLLVGRLAFDGKDTREVLRKVRDGRFVAPSEANSNVPKPLGSVCLKSMSLGQQDRYQSAVELADDIKHWLADEPVSAHADSFVDRAFRWLRHHRSWGIAGAFALFFITAISVLAAILVNNARQETEVACQEAVHRFQQAREAVDVWLTGTKDELTYYPGMDAIRIRLLERAAADYEDFARGSDWNAGIEVERGRTLLRLGDIRAELGEHSVARDAYHDAIRAFRDVSLRDPGLLAGHLGQAKAFTKLGISLRKTGKYSESKETLETALAALENVPWSQSEDCRVKEARGIALSTLALSFIDIGSRDRAMLLFSQAIDELEQVEYHPHKKLQTADALATTRHVFGRLLTDVGQYAEASRQIRQSLIAFGDLVERNRRHLSGRIDVWNSLATLARVQGNCSEERECHENSLADCKELLGVFPHSPVLIQKCAITRINLAQLFDLLDRPLEAEEELTTALTQLEDLLSFFEDLSSSHSYYEYWLTRATCLDALGQIYVEQGHSDEAQRAFTTAIDTVDSLTDSPIAAQQCQSRLAVMESHCARLFQKLGKHKEAHVLFDDSSKRLRALLEKQPDRLATLNELAFVLRYQARLCHETGDAEKARKLFAKAAAAWEKLLKQQQPPAAQHLRDYAWFLATCVDAAVRNPQRAVELARRAVDTSEDNPTFQSTLGVALIRVGEPQKAKDAFEEANKCRGQRNACDWFFLSQAAWQQGDKEQARECFEKAVDWMDERRPENAELQQFRVESASLLGI